MKQLRIQDPWECVLAVLLLRWEQNAPPDRHWGELDGVPTCNSQEARLAYVLQKVAVGQVNGVYSSLARYTRREKDSNSYISRDSSWMGSAHPLWEGWYVEGRQSLPQKHDLLDKLTKLGLSPVFKACAKDFVAGSSIEKYLPTNEESKVMLNTALQQCKRQATRQCSLI